MLFLFERMFDFMSRRKDQSFALASPIADPSPLAAQLPLAEQRLPDGQHAEQLAALVVVDLFQSQLHLCQDPGSGTV